MAQAPRRPSPVYDATRAGVCTSPRCPRSDEVPRVLPKSKIGEAVGYAANQWQTLTRYLEDGRLTIDNAPAEQAIRPLAVGRRNWLQIAGDGALKSAAVLLSVAASAKRHGVNPWSYVRHSLTACAGRQRDADYSDLLPDVWTLALARPLSTAS